MRIQRGQGNGVLTPLKITKYRVSLYYWSGSPENHKATKPAFNVGHYLHASKMPLQWRFAGRPINACLWSFLEPRSPRKNKTNKKQTYQSWPPSDKTFCIRACCFIFCIWKNSYKNHIKIFEIDFVIEIHLYLTFWPQPRGWGKSFLAVANPIYVRNSHTKFGWISFNGKDGLWWCEKILGDFFYRKVLLAYRSLQNVFAGLI